MGDLIDFLVKKYGEQYRRLIADALDWLDKREPVWKLTEPMDREGFIENLMESVIPKDSGEE